MQKHRSTAAGFTLAELMIATFIFVVLSAGGMALLGTAAPAIRANGQVNRVLSLMQRGRESAITRQRLHIVDFDEANSTINLIRVEGDEQILIETLVFEYGIAIHKFTDSPDTPEGYGNEGAVDFGGASEVMFNSEGSFVNGAGLPQNGSLFLGEPGKPATARAVTLTGSTGRARFYIWNGDQEWAGGWLAK
jgi:type II secretory pathway pseudopilin PulG